MGKFLKNVGNFQANVGYFSADFGVIMSYVIAGILTLIAIGLAITALIPMKPWDCAYDYDFPIDEDEKKRCNTKVKHLWLLWFLLLIPLAVLIVFFSKWWKGYVHKNKTAAQVGGTLFEVSTLKNIFSN